MTAAGPACWFQRALIFLVSLPLAIASIVWGSLSRGAFQTVAEAFPCLAGRLLCGLGDPRRLWRLLGHGNRALRHRRRHGLRVLRCGLDAHGRRHGRVPHPRIVVRRAGDLGTRFQFRRAIDRHDQREHLHPVPGSAPRMGDLALGCVGDAHRHAARHLPGGPARPRDRHQDLLRHHLGELRRAASLPHGRHLREYRRDPRRAPLRPQCGLHSRAPRRRLRGFDHRRGDRHAFTR